MRALAKNPDDRYQSADQMEADLERIPGIEEVQAVRSVRVQYQGLPMMVVGMSGRIGGCVGTSGVTVVAALLLRRSGSNWSL